LLFKAAIDRNIDVSDFGSMEKAAKIRLLFVFKET
jgi:hypothetical protein